MPTTKPVKATKDNLRTHLRVYNDNDLSKLAAWLGAPDVYVSYRSDTGRGGTGRWWGVSRPGHNLNVDDPKTGYTHWYRYHSARPFPLGNYPGDTTAAKDHALRHAIEWASQRYNLDPERWVRTPFGGYVSQATMDAVAAELARVRR